MNRSKWFIGLLLGLLCVQTHAMRGGRSVECFDDGWLFCRYGLQADGSRVDEPQGLEAAEADDAGWRKLCLPHDWAIEGPFRNDLEGFTAKLPWKGIGWYRKYFSLPQSGQGQQVYLDFDGAMANTQVWLNGHLADGLQSARLKIKAKGE